MQQKLDYINSRIAGQIEYRRQIASRGRTIDPQSWSSLYLKAMLQLAEKLSFEQEATR